MYIYTYIYYIYMYTLYIYIYIHIYMHHLYRDCIPEASPHIHRGLARGAVISLWSSKCLPCPLSHICWTPPRPEAPEITALKFVAWMDAPAGSFSFFLWQTKNWQRIQQPTVASLNSHVKFLVAPFLVHWNSAWKLLTGDKGQTFYIFPPKLREASWTCNGSWSNSPLFPFGFNPLCKLSVAARRNPLEKTLNGSSFFKRPLYEGGITIQTLWICDPEPKLLSADTRSAQLCLGLSGQPGSAWLSLSLQAAWEHSSWMGPQASKASKAGGASIAVTADIQTGPAMMEFAAWDPACFKLLGIYPNVWWVI